MKSTNETLLENLCRACMEDKKYKTISIFNETDHIEDNKVTIMELLLLTTPQLNIEKGDMLPKLLCENCVEKLVNAYKFQKMCITVEEKLRQLFNERDILKSQVIMDPLNGTSDLFKAEIDEQLIDINEQTINVPVFNNEGVEKDVKVETDDNQLSSSIQFDNGICSEESEWEVHKTKVSKSSNKDDQSKNFVCDECGSRLKTKKSLNRHKKIHLRPPTATSPKKMEHIKTSEESSNKDDKVENFECDECGSHLKTKQSLRRHKKIHSKPPPGQEDKYKCEVCEKRFRYSVSLKEHLRTHTGEKPHLCTECGKAFNRASCLAQHYLRHGTNRPYECPICPKRFRCVTDLLSHKLTHDDKKPYVCDICGKAFSFSYILKRHKLYHSGERNYKCDYCEKRFFVGNQYRRHIRTHTGEKPYKCKYCEKAFSQSNDMIKHLRVHLGDNVYRCDLCPQGFPLQRDLLVHICIHKNDDEETRARNLQALKDEEQRILIKCGLLKDR